MKDPAVSSLKDFLFSNPCLSNGAFRHDGDIRAKNPIETFYPLQVDMDEFDGRQTAGFDQPGLISNPEIADILIYGTFSFT